MLFLPEGPIQTRLRCYLLAYRRWDVPLARVAPLKLKAFIHRKKIRQCVIVADNDCDREIGGRTYNSGFDGAIALQKMLPVPSCIVTFPCKDAREFVRLGGDRKMLESLTMNCIWRNP